jgi:hypothetical protein
MEGELKIYSISGRMIVSEHAIQNHFVELKKGAYIVEVKSNNKLAKVKIII